jgi:hypothetical protein
MHEASLQEELNEICVGKNARNCVLHVMSLQPEIVLVQ